MSAAETGPMVARVSAHFGSRSECFALLTLFLSNAVKVGFALNDLRKLPSGKWRGNCHPGELGAALRKLGYKRKRNWSKSNGVLKAS